MKKILIVNDYLKGGGVENVLENLVCYLIDGEYNVSLMLTNSTQEDVKEFFGDRVNFYAPMPPMKKLRRFSIRWFVDRGLYFIQRLLYRFRFFFCRFDVVIALKEGQIMKDVSKLYANKKIAWVHTDFSSLHWSEKAFRSGSHERKCMAKYDAVVCVSETAENAVKQTIGDPGNLIVKYNPINYNEILKKSTANCDLVKSKDFLIVSVGRLAYPKNFSLLIDVCNELSADYSFEVWIIGDGPDRAMLEDKINLYGLSCVKLLGSCDNPYPYMNQADVFASTSVSESYGLSVQEALVLGKPVVAVNCPAIAENVDCSFGVLVDNSCDSLKNAIEQFLNSAQKLDCYRQNIKTSYKTEDLFENRLKKIEKLWVD